MDTFDLTTPPGRGQGDCAPTISKYVFDPARIVIFDTEVFPGRWCVGFLHPDGNRRCIDGDRAQLAEVLDRVAADGMALVGYNIDGYDIPVLRAILANTDPYPVSHALVHHDGPGQPESVRALIGGWPRVEADHVDLAARTQSGGRFPGLKTIAANLNCPHLEELPYDPESLLSDAEWGEVRQYNRRDLEATKAALAHFTPELAALTALSNRYDLDLRNVHPAAVAQRVLCAAYRAKHGSDPTKIPPPASVRYSPPKLSGSGSGSPVRRPQTPSAGAWFDRLCGEEFPLVVPQGKRHPVPLLPEPDGPIVIGGVTLTVGSGGLHSCDRPALHRYGEHQLYEADVQSYYPSMMAQFGIFPRALGEVGLEQYREILTERIEIKERAGRAADPEEARRLKVQAHGLKIVLNSLFGQTGNPYSTLYDPTAFMAVVLTGQLLLIDLIERLAAAGAEVLSANTDGVYFRVAGDNDRWTGVIDEWESDTQMVLETIPVEALAIESTNNYATQQFPVTPPLGAARRRGTLSDTVAWNRVPNGMVIADAVCAALFDGTLPEVTVRACVDPSKFAYITRRDRGKDGVLIDEESGEETPIPRLVRWYKAKGSPLRIEHRWTDEAGKAKTTTPPGASGVRLMMDLPAVVPGDVDLWWYVGEARARIMANPDFPHLDPKWLAGAPGAEHLHALGLSPSPKWDGKKAPRGAVKDRPSYFWDWARYHTFGTHTGPGVAILVLDVDEPGRFRKWVGKIGGYASLDGCMVSYHQADSPDAVRSGTARGKLIFKFEADADHPLAKVGKAALRGSLGVEVFYGHGDPTIMGAHPDGPAQNYLLEGVLGPPPGWLIDDLVGLASKKLTKRTTKRRTASPGGNGSGATPGVIAKYARAALEAEVATVSAAPEGERNCTVWKAACAIGSLVGAGALDRVEAEERLTAATTLPEDEAADVVCRGLDRGVAHPRDLARVCEYPGTREPVGRDGERPVIEITTAEHQVNDAAVAALTADPGLYQRGNLLVRVLRAGPLPDDTVAGRDPGAPTIIPIHAATVRERLTKYASWVKLRREGEEWVLAPAHPPEWVTPAVLNRGAWEGVRWLEGVTETPLFLPDGSILERPGFDRRSGLLYIPEIRFPRVPENPSRDDATGAAHTLFGLVADFPFKGPSHRSAWLAALLTPFVRATLPGLAPLFVFDSNAAGSGKTMLCDLISIVGTGRCVGRTGYPATDEEMDKVTLALALGGTKMVLFDNQATGSPIGGAALDAVLTATTRSGRILGLSRFVTDVPFHATIFCTGNNVALKGDTLRRVVLCRLESPLERPEERDNFAVANLLADVRERRGDLAVAALTILRAYHVAGRPVPDPKPTPMGGFEAWVNLVRRAVHWVSDHDPCATKSEAKAADRTATQLPALIEGWAALCRSVGAEALSTAQALKALEESPGVHADLRTLLAESTKDGRLPSPQGLGNMLGRVRGRPVAGRALDRTEIHGLYHWFVRETVSPTETPF